MPQPECDDMSPELKAKFKEFSAMKTQERARKASAKKQDAGKSDAVKKVAAILKRKS